ncbi:MAG TPA: uroporphyrinogen-III synthase [Roseiarcus sp.]
MQTKRFDAPASLLPPGEGGARSAPDEGSNPKAKARFAREPSPQSLSRSRGGACPRVALFRERKDANASAAQLRKLGFSVVCLPVIEIQTRPIRPQRSHYGAVVATSDKAFHADGPSDTSSPLYVVGARTGRAAVARGWRLASPPARDADEMVRTLAGALKPEASVLYLAGRDRKEIIEAALSGAFGVEIAEAYTAEAREAWRPAEARSLASCVAALHYSRRSANLAATLAKAAGVEACFLKLKHVCMSRDVAEPLQAIGASRIAIAETPDEAGLFRSLREELGGFPSLGSSRI